MNDPGTDPVGNSRSSDEPAPDEILAQLGRVLSSPDFAKSHRLKKFLRFIVEETLAGRAGRLKEYSIALEVFDRDESFDPQTNSIVRVEASRLRAKLKQYNVIVGSKDPIHIVLVAGRYVPSFNVPAPPLSTSRDHGPDHS